MSRQISLYRPGIRNVTDGSISPATFAFTSWAAIRALTGDEVDKAQQITQEVEHVITVPYQLGIAESWTVQFEDRMFQIKYLEDEDEQHIFLDLFCEEIGQSAGT
jgi:SPP1 family predicted phage head-tail adaptor